jgi:hypothetical protein
MPPIARVVKYLCLEAEMLMSSQMLQNYCRSLVHRLSPHRLEVVDRLQTILTQMLM